MSTGRRILLCVTAACALALCAPAASLASHTAFQLISSGNGALVTQFSGATADGLRVFTRTEDTATGTDTDPEFDVFEHAGGITTQLSLGPAGGNGDFGVEFGGATPDGSRVFFQTPESLVGADSDDCNPDPAFAACGDVYERAGTTTTLVSTGPQVPDPVATARFLGASEDGQRVFFLTRQALVGGDGETEEADIYERAGGTTSLVSTGPAGGSAAITPVYGGASADGTRVFFTTREKLVASDTDTAGDVYERSGGATTLVSTGPASGGTPGATFRGASRDGTRVFFETTERLVSGDTDSAIDLYERAGGTTTLLSTGPAGGNGSPDARYTGASEGGTRVFFQTTEALTSSDGDSRMDVYERSGTTTTHVSTGPSDDGAFDAAFQGDSRDGSSVVFGTTESVTAGDTDGRYDVYKRAGGSTTLLSTGPAGGNDPIDAFYGGMSEDGQRVFFESQEQLTDDDTDAYTDVYEREGSATTRVSKGPDTAGNGDWLAIFVGASADGSRVFFSSAEKLSTADTDVFSDIYMASVTANYPRPKSASPVKVSLVPSYKECLTPNRVHGPALTNPSCNPPLQTSDHLTVGTADSNGRPNKFTGEANFIAILGDPGTQADEADVALEIMLTDVRRKSDLEDYTGELAASASVRITDKYNGTFPIDSGTVSDIPFPVTVPCTATTDTTVGSTCTATTTVEALAPGAIKEKARTIWQLGRVVVDDGGADGDAGTQPNTPFARQGVFIP